MSDVKAEGHIPYLGSIMFLSVIGLPNYGSQRERK